jgi:heme exporter protein C
MSMFIYVVMAFWAGDVPCVQYAAFGHDGDRARADRCFVHLRRPVDGLALGQAHVGNVVGVGRTAHFELILLFLYFGFMALHAAIEDPLAQTAAAAVLALVASSTCRSSISR